MYKRLKELRMNNNYTQKQIAELLGKDRVTYIRYETGVLDIPVKDLIVLSKLYNVSTDYILGVSDKQ